VALDERLKHELERAGRPADPSGVYEDLIRLRERHRIVRRMQSSALAVVVLAASIAGVYGLSRIVGPGGSTAGVDPSPFPIVPLENGRITYSMSTNDGMELHSVLPDGTEQQAIPTPEGLPWLHSWSPDGTKIAVSVFPARDGNRSIWVMNGDGSDPVRVASAENVSVPSWSADGTTIAYTARTDERTEIHIVSADGTNDRVLHAEDAEGTFAIFSAKFSPDGTQILFDRGTDLGFDIFVMNVDGTAGRQLTTTGTDYDPHWSPDGTQIAFTRQEIVQVDGMRRATSNIFVMNADGTDVRRLTDRDHFSTLLDPEWSPDGTKIAYVNAVTGGPGSLVVMDPDGSNPVTLVERDVVSISWQPLPSTDIPVEPQPSQPEGRGQQDIGLGFPVCDVTSVDGQFAVDVHGRAFVATRTGDTGRCPTGEGGPQVLAVDVTGDGLADASYGPLECDWFCSAFSAPDVNGDGVDEILIQNVQFSIAGLQLFAVVDDADIPTVEPVTIAPPGDPEGGLEPGAIAQLWLGGDAFSLSTLRCGTLDTPDGPGIIFTEAESVPHDSPDAEWHAHEVTFALRNTELHVIDVRDFTEPVSTDAPSFQSGQRLCGSNLGPSQLPSG
jgi:TolB protein